MKYTATIIFGKEQVDKINNNGHIKEELDLNVKDIL